MERKQELELELHRALQENQKLEFANISLQSKNAALEFVNTGLGSTDIELEPLKEQLESKLHKLSNELPYLRRVIFGRSSERYLREDPTQLKLLERIREIRASERRFYQKITDIYALSVDYDRNSPATKEFFATVQNKLHWAITGKIATEIIYTSADATKLYMELTNWKQAPDGKILKSDVVVAKNYLNEAHIKILNRLVSAYLDLAENRALRGITTNMQDWIRFLNQFLELSEFPVLQDHGKVSALEAKLKAEQECEVYRKIQDKNYISDFDREIKRVQGKQK
jgi:hypothetical protein